MNDKILTIKKSTLVDIANEVRAKTGSTDLIKVADLDDAVANLQGGGGGIVEVDELMTGIVSGQNISCDTVYLNTSLSTDEVITEIKKVTQDLDAIYGDMAVVRYVIEFYADDQYQNMIGGLSFENDLIYNSDNSSSYSDRWVMSYRYYDDNYNSHNTYIFDSSNGGWASDFNGEINVNATTVWSYIQWNNNANWGDQDPYDLYGNVDKNSSIMKLVSSTGSFEVPEVDTIYKLPDETLWMYEDGWKKLAKQKKVTIINDAGYELTFGVYPDCENLVSEDMRDFDGTINQVTLPENGTLELYVTASVAIYNTYHIGVHEDSLVNARAIPLDEFDDSNDRATIVTLTGDNAVIHIVGIEM